MSLRLRRRRVEILVPETWLGKAKDQVVKARYKVTPVAADMASSAKDVAAHRIIDARAWAAPKLDQAAHAVEDQLAPKVSAMLTQAAKRVDPGKSRRRWPVVVLLSGIALGAAGFAVYRTNARRWTESMKEAVHDSAETVKQTASDAGKWLHDKAEDSRDKTRENSDQISGKLH